MEKSLHFTNKKGKKYEVKRNDPLNFVVIEHYKGKTKEGKATDKEKVIGYFSKLQSALYRVAELQTEEAMLAGENLDLAIRRLAKFYVEGKWCNIKSN